MWLGLVLMTAAAVDSCADSLEAGEWRAAERHCTEALRQIEKQWGRDHPISARVLNNLGTLYLAQRRYTKAEEMYRRSLAVREKAGAPGPVIAEALLDLGALQYARHRLGEGEETLRRALALGPVGPDRAAGLHTLALVYCREGRWAETIDLEREALTLLERSPGHNKMLVGVLLTLADSHGKQGREEVEKALIDRARLIAESVLGPSHWCTGEVLLRQARLAKSERRRKEAKELRRRAEAILEADARARGVFAIVDASEFQPKRGR